MPLMPFDPEIVNNYWSPKNITRKKKTKKQKNKKTKTKNNKTKRNMPLMVFFLLRVSLSLPFICLLSKHFHPAHYEMTFQLIDFLLCTFIYFMNLYNYHLTQALQNNYCTVCSSPH